MINYIIVDDDELQIDFLQMHLSQIAGLYCTATYTNAFEARNKIIEQRPELVILDVEMPGLTGIQLVKSLNNPPCVIFVSSHSSYAADAFEVEAIDFIVKPVAPERLMRTIDKAVMTIEHVAAGSVGNMDGFSIERNAFFVKDKNVHIKIEYSDVLYIESSGNFSVIYFANHGKQLVLANLAKMEAQLPSNRFVRISRSLIINIEHISSIGMDTLFIKEEELAIGKPFLDKVMKEVVGKNCIRRS
ncbi:MAG: response regulator transcription factor [Sphingobacteriales bacterium]|nr:MAG: response regulator transcription factor [Sphingobacteriales bacterium]